jgi:hypothetical protein
MGWADGIHEDGVPNSDRDLAMYFGTPERPVSINEFFHFWSFLTTEEKIYFRWTKLV